MPAYREPAIPTTWLSQVRIDHDALARDARAFVEAHVPRPAGQRAVSPVPGASQLVDWDDRVDAAVERVRRALAGIERARSKPMGRYRHPLWRAKNRLRIAQIDLNHWLHVRDSYQARRPS